MPAFDPEQQETLLTMGRILELLARAVVHQAERRGRVQIAELRKILVGQGVTSEEEIEAAVREMEAILAVEEALNPELQAAREELRELMEQMGRGQDEEK